MFYLAIPPSLFGTVAKGLAQSRLRGAARLMVEKPFGRDLASAQALNATLHRFFPNRRFIASIIFSARSRSRTCSTCGLPTRFSSRSGTGTTSTYEVTMAEDFGVRGRGRFYEEVGAMRDVFQNHLLQVLTILTMEAPVAKDATAIADAKVALLRAVRPLQPTRSSAASTRATAARTASPPDSHDRNLYRRRLAIDNWRWAGVPFLIRAGKCLPVTLTEVRVR